MPWQWLELSTANLSVVAPPNTSAGFSYRAGRVDAWNGMAALGTSVYMAGVGGHADWAGNEAYRCDLAAANPVWTMLNQPTPDASIRTDVTHYADGRPTSSHTYYSLHGDALRGKIFRFGIGSAWGSGNFQRPNVDAFDLARNDWDAANTWPSVPEAISYAKSQVQHPLTGDTYVVGASYLWRFTRASGSWARLAALPNNGSAAYYRAAVLDTRRNAIVILGDHYRQPAGVLIYDIAANTWANNRSLSGAQAATVTAQAGHAAHYNAAVDRYIVKTNVAGQVIAVDPVTLEATVLATTGGTNVPQAVNGVFGKFVAMPQLGGYAYQPNGSAKLWFLAAP